MLTYCALSLAYMRRASYKLMMSTVDVILFISFSGVGGFECRVHKKRLDAKNGQPLSRELVR